MSGEELTQRPGKHRLRTPFPMPAPEVLDAMARYLYKHYRRRWMTPTNTLEEAIEAYRKLKVFEKASAPRRTGEDDPSEPVPPPVQA